MMAVPVSSRATVTFLQRAMGGVSLTLYSETRPDSSPLLALEGAPTAK